MLTTIIFCIISFVLFAYIFLFKMIKKNDTTYLSILILEAVGILITFMQILFGILNGLGFKTITFLLCILFPSIVLILEYRGLNFSEIIYIIASKIFKMRGNNKRAKEVLVNLVTKYNNSYLGHKALAEMYEQEGGMRKAIDEYVKVLDINTSDYKSYYKISILLNDLTKKDEAIEMLHNLLEKKPEFCEATELLGDILLEKENFKEAIKVYVRGIKYHPENYKLYYNLGIAYARTNDFSLSKECFKKTVEINNNYYVAYYRLGQISLLYRDIEAAEKYFLQSIYEKMEAKSYYQLSKIYIMKNQRDKAIIFINKAIALDANYYKKATEEPILFAVKQNLTIPEQNSDNEEENQKIDEKEKNIEEYLDDTYNLTKNLDDQDNKTAIKKFKWNK